MLAKGLIVAMLHPDPGQRISIVAAMRHPLCATSTFPLTRGHASLVDLSTNVDQETSSLPVAIASQSSDLQMTTAAATSSKHPDETSEGNLVNIEFVGEDCSLTNMPIASEVTSPMYAMPTIATTAEGSTIISDVEPFAYVFNDVSKDSESTIIRNISCSLLSDQEEKSSTNHHPFSITTEGDSNRNYIPEHLRQACDRFEMSSTQTPVIDDLESVETDNGSDDMFMMEVDDDEWNSKIEKDRKPESFMSTKSSKRHMMETPPIFPFLDARSAPEVDKVAEFESYASFRIRSSGSLVNFTKGKF